MCASSPEKVEILDPPPGCQPGERVTCPGFTGEGRGPGNGCYYKPLNMGYFSLVQWFKSGLPEINH